MKNLLNGQRAYMLRYFPAWNAILIDYYRKKNKSKTKFVQLSTKYNFSISVVTKLEILVGVNPEQRIFWQEVFQKMKILPLTEKDFKRIDNLKILEE